MEDYCAVCAEPLEWVAYGPCGHREVCSTCTVRLRIVLDDTRCCICKQECQVIYVTKALGDYTKVVPDFNSLESRVPGDLWFDPEVGAYFDDEDEFNRIKAMCKLQCKVCETSNAPANGFVRKGFIFKTLDALRRHLYGVHRFTMCELCLEGRKVFIQDQKLYTKAQLERHSRGESKIDGNEDGFMGHPICAFCNRRFYGDNELYHHMSTEHFTCHICRRSRPAEFDYFENYDDLEAHFRNEHALCEHPDCLAKKFVVFSTEGELKLHNAKEHGGTLSRAQRNAAMKIPLSHTYRRGQSSQDNRRGSYYRNRDHDLNAELFSAMRDSLETAAVEEANRESVGTDASGPAMGPENFPALVQTSAPDADSATAERDPRYRAAVHGPETTLRSDSAFPPLPGGTQPQPQHQQQHARSMAALLGSRGRNNVKVLHAADRRQAPQPTVMQANGTASRISQDFPDLAGSKADAGGHSVNAVSGRGPPPAARAPPPPGWPPLLNSTTSSSGGGKANQPTQIHGTLASSSSSSGGGKASQPTQIHGTLPSSSSSSSMPLTMDEIRAATKLLIEDIRGRLKGDEERFADFKEVQSEFRKGDISAKTYYDRVARLGLSVIIPELARLCPDPQKQQELEMVMKEQETNSSRPGGKKTSKARQTEETAQEEVLGTDGYRRAKQQPAGPPPVSFEAAPSTTSSNDPRLVSRAAESKASVGSSGWACETCTLVNPTSSSQCAACGWKQESSSAEELRKKKNKKVSKFNRMRLGGEVVQEDEETGAAAAAAAPVVAGNPRGAWRNGGGQRLVSRSSS